MSETTPVKRRAMTRAEVIEILLNQGADLFALVQALPPRRRLPEKAIWTLLEQHGIKIPCGNFQSCATLIHTRKDCIRDHKIPLRGSPEATRVTHDRPWNQWYLCHSCNRLKTSQRGLTGLGSDAARIAKLRRVEAKAGANLHGERPAGNTKEEEDQPCPMTARIRKKTLPSRPFTPSASKFGSSRNGPERLKNKLKAKPLFKAKIPSRPFPSKTGKKEAK